VATQITPLPKSILATRIEIHAFLSRLDFCQQLPGIYGTFAGRRHSGCTCWFAKRPDASGQRAALAAYARRNLLMRSIASMGILALRGMPPPVCQHHLAVRAGVGRTSNAIPPIEAGEAPCVARMVRAPGPCATWAESRSIFAGCVGAALAFKPTREHVALGGKTAGRDNHHGGQSNTQQSQATFCLEKANRGRKAREKVGRGAGAA
jgi:hypothetical protein